ncbi:ABC transporter ATP-binding protein [Singulisphaera sp. Ch08]|uniref:ABC transporter ATP-binding protein n=1 Tax=Singulisphaera sp. Ch08 TaxID=3120278 RepID=A0AAU7CUP6_9BACT
MIEADDVRKTFQSGDEVVEALRGVTFRLPAGSCTFIVGPSGSGKSTLLYLLAALDLPTSGTIRVADHDITAMSEAGGDDFRRNRVGFVYQTFNLISNLTAVDNVLLPYFPLGVTRELRAKAHELLEEVGLGHRMKLRPRQMSGGEQQRVAIARALIKDPLVIYADEPTGSLDRAGGSRIIQLLRDRQQAANRTLVIVTHDHRFISGDDLVLEIEDGRIKGEPSPTPNPAGAAT